MRTYFYTYQRVNDIEAEHAVAIHALREFRSWRDNGFIGQNLGCARSAYVSILHRRARMALKAHRLMRAFAHNAPFHKAA
jgi:hypothetical protein